MPHVRTLERRRFSEAGPLPQVLNIGENLAVMLLCLQKGQELRAPEGDSSETLFSVLGGEGLVVEGETRHAVKTGDIVHVLSGENKALIAGSGKMSVLGVRHLKGRS